MRKMLVLMVIVSVAAYAQQPASLEDTLVWMHNFVADNGGQFTGQRNTDKGACKLVPQTASRAMMLQLSIVTVVSLR